MKLNYIKDRMFSQYLGLFSEKGKTNPIFIIGSGRCGSTLLSSILNCHPRIFFPQENTLAIKLLKSWAFKISRKNKLSCFTNVLNNEYIWNTKSEQILKRIDNFRSEDLNYAKVIENIFNERAKEVRKPNARWGDQTVGNSNYILSLKSQFPDCKVIYLTRDPRSVAASYFNINRKYYTLQSVINKWETAFDKFEYLKQKYPKDTYILNYNSLVSETDEVIISVMNWLEENLDFLDLRLRETNADYLIAKGSTHHSNLKNPISTGSIDKWKNTLNSSEVKYIEQKLIKKYESICY